MTPKENLQLYIDSYKISSEPDNDDMTPEKIEQEQRENEQNAASGEYQRAALEQDKINKDLGKGTTTAGVAGALIAPSIYSAIKYLRGKKPSAVGIAGWAGAGYLGGKSGRFVYNFTRPGMKENFAASTERLHSARQRVLKAFEKELES